MLRDLLFNVQSRTSRGTGIPGGLLKCKISGRASDQPNQNLSLNKIERRFSCILEMGSSGQKGFSQLIVVNYLAYEVGV